MSSRRVQAASTVRARARRGGLARFTTTALRCAIVPLAAGSASRHHATAPDPSACDRQTTALGRSRLDQAHAVVESTEQRCSRWCRAAWASSTWGGVRTRQCVLTTFWLGSTTDRRVNLNLLPLVASLLCPRLIVRSGGPNAAGERGARCRSSRPIPRARCRYPAPRRDIAPGRDSPRTRAWPAGPARSPAPSPPPGRTARDPVRGRRRGRATARDRPGREQMRVPRATDARRSLSRPDRSGRRARRRRRRRGRRGCAPGRRRGRAGD
jgi:hypothetical protein